MNFISVRLDLRLPLVVHRAYKPHLCRGYIVSIEPKRAYFALKTYLKGKYFDDQIISKLVGKD